VTDLDRAAVDKEQGLAPVRPRLVVDDLPHQAPGRLRTMELELVVDAHGEILEVVPPPAPWQTGGEHTVEGRGGG